MRSSMPLATHPANANATAAHKAHVAPASVLKQPGQAGQAACHAGAMRGHAEHDETLIGRQEQAEARAAQRHRQHHRPHRRAGRQPTHAQEARGQQRQADHAKQAGRHAVRPFAGERRQARAHDRPWCDQHSHFGDVAPQRLVQQERQRDHGRALRGESQYADQHRHREGRQTQQVPRHDGVRAHALAAQQQRPAHHAQRPDKGDAPVRPRHALQAQDGQAEGQRAQQGSACIQRLAVARRPGQITARQRQRDQAERHVHIEQPVPAKHRQHRRCQDRPARQRGRRDHGVQSHAPAQLFFRIDGADQRHVATHQRRGGQALHRPGRLQRPQRRCRAAPDRRQQK
ncbi:hypothetical protein G6F57_016702 [Rhizopus arrhizus]|nr:hypothetical protein G6F57_016702 [Rhizopus arrhizus]